MLQAARIIFIFAVLGVILGTVIYAIISVIRKKSFFMNIKVIIIKAVIIFVVGFTFRFMIIYFNDINVFKDIFHPLSIIYYAFMSLFGSFIHIYNIPLILSSFMLNLVNTLKDEKMTIKLGNVKDDIKYYINYMDNNSDKSNNSTPNNSDNSGSGVSNNGDTGSSNSNNPTSSSTSANPGPSNPSNPGPSNPGPINSGPSDPDYTDSYVRGSRDPKYFGENDPYKNAYGLIHPQAIDTDGRPGTPVCQDDKVGVANYINHISALKEDIECLEENLKDTNEGIKVLTAIAREKRSLVDATAEEKNKLDEAEIDTDDPRVLASAIRKKHEINGIMWRKKDDLSYMTKKFVEKNLSVPVRDDSTVNEANSNNIERENKESSIERINSPNNKDLDDKDKDSNNKRSSSEDNSDNDSSHSVKRPRTVN